MKRDTKATATSKTGIKVLRKDDSEGDWFCEDPTFESCGWEST